MELSRSRAIGGVDDLYRSVQVVAETGSDDTGAVSGVCIVKQQTCQDNQK